ncbi:hypothetical protein [Amycolatopsis cihanbeyliensis]|uniref:Uncharacterized protein n=1 Tax=Amycolatopsis cihanbeyliensis TaxID=1128664 RepID=A0A542CSQ7_AMYCI|nr:hypothetical protein [Amycolatopsis cihanbeyliensis]TQI93863.1 hypothetical protein FB471_6008 [Amycolatopsis cihanbeyliensis]
MADTEETEKTPEPTRRQLAAARQFVARHGTPSRAVVEHVGRGGARVVLVGDDGALGDIVVPGPATGEALVAAVADLELSSWDADTVNATEIGARHRRRMAASWTRA